MEWNIREAKCWQILLQEGGLQYRYRSVGQIMLQL